MKSNPDTTRACKERSQKRARESQKPRPPIRAVSPKRAAQNSEYSRVRTAYLNSHPICARCASEGRNAPATQIHDAGGREGARLVDSSLFIGCCGPCHDWIHAHPLAAREVGLLGSKHLEK